MADRKRDELVPRSHPIATGRDPASQREWPGDGESAVERLRRGGEVSDRDFDALLPAPARSFSRTYWVPVAVARAAAAILVERPGDRVLDLGAGAGKFCAVGALTTSGHFTGVELNRELVSVAAGFARSHGVERVVYRCGDLLKLDWTGFAGYFLFNPFASAFASARQGVKALAVGFADREGHAKRCQARLKTAPVGTKAVLYWGYGAPMPDGWELCETLQVAGEGLEYWRRGG